MKRLGLVLMVLALALWVAPAQASPRVHLPSTGWDMTSATTATQMQIRHSLILEERYLLTTGRHHPPRPTTTELTYRPPAMAAMTLAIGLHLDAYSAHTTGVSRKKARAYVASLIKRVATAHVPAKRTWGEHFETAHWSLLTGIAAWLSWHDLSPSTQHSVVRMVKTEANHLLADHDIWWSMANGTEVHPGDTKAEEDAWNSEMLMLASYMLPHASHAARWKAQGISLATAAYATQRDGLAGYNALPWGAVVNHHIVHPDYANSIQLLWQSADLAVLAHRFVPHVFHNASLVYSGLSTHSYVAGDPSPAGGSYSEPGGTVYTDTPDLYFPQGDDWGSAREALWVSLDQHADTYRDYVQPTGMDPTQALALHEQGQRHLQATSGASDGRTYSVTNPSSEDTYPGREEYAAVNLATAWLAVYAQKSGWIR